MPNQPLVSIIISSYNYARYVRETIDSALGQTYRPIEVIVVDDGSTDGSQDVIASYGEAVQAICKPNGGQASSANAGFAASRGELVMFLDSDDLLLPEAIERVVAAFRPDVSIVQFRLQVVDADGRPTGRVIPPLEHAMPNGHERENLLKGKSYPSPPTSGNVYRRDVLARFMPIPTGSWLHHIDTYQMTLAAMVGAIVSIDTPCGLYRVHGKNESYSIEGFDVAHLARYVEQMLIRTDLIRDWAAREGLAVGRHMDHQCPGEMTRMMALKQLAPDHPLVAAHGTWWLAWRGIAAIATDPYPPGLVRRLAGMGWYLAMALLPRAVAVDLAEWTLFKRRRTKRPLALQQA